jgi:cytoplasmic iron level regulating protein YaaA (DUF328/UPF0246 family)
MFIFTYNKLKQYNMSYSRFNRHESMDSETLSEIMDIKQEFYRKDIERNSDIRSLENMLSGLFDGYLYDKIQILALKLPTDLATRIMKVYFTCSKYPKSETQVY